MVKRKDFQKVAALIHEFLLKLGDGAECAELRDALNLALFHLQRYYRLLQKRLNNTLRNSLQETFQVYGSTTFSQDPRDKFTWKWIDLEKSGTSERHNPDADRIPELLCASQMGDNGLIVQIIEQGNGSELHETDVLGRSALMYAVNFSQLDTVEFLLNQGISINSTASDGATALHWACHNGNDEALEIMLQYDADVTIGDAFGRMPIHWAAVCQDTKCLQLLLDRGTDVSAADHDGMTPSMWASHVDCLEHLMLLQGYLEKDKLERDHRGRTWVHWSVRRDEPLRCLTTLLNDDLSLVCDDEGKTAMHTAAELGSLPAIKVILNISGNHCLEQRDHSNRTPLILATMGGHGESVNLLLAEGADPASVDECDATAWDYARARQLHYCMLIIASYLRQQQKQDDVSSPDGTTNNAQLPVAGEKVARVSGPIRSLPHPPAPSNYRPAGVVRTPRSSRLGSQTSHASENVEDESEHVSAFWKVVSRKVDHPTAFENSEVNNSLRDEKTKEEQRGNGRERITNHNVISQGSKPEENKRRNRNKLRNSTTHRRNGRRPIDDEDDDKDWTTEESDGEIRPKHSLNRDDLVTPATTRRRQSASRERQVMMMADVKSNVVRPMNPATKYYDLKDDYSATDEDKNEESQDEGDRLKPGFNSFATTTTSNNAHVKQSRNIRSRTQAPVAEQRKPQVQQHQFANNEVDSEEVESDIDESLDEVMAGYRNGGRRRNSQSKAVEKTLNKQGTSQGTRTGKQSNRSQSAAHTEGRILNSAAMDEPPAKYHTRHPGRRKDERVTSPPPEPRNFALSRDASPFELMPLSSGSEPKSRPRMASVPSKGIHLTSAPGSFTPSPRSSGVSSISPRGGDRPLAGAGENSRKGHSNSGMMVNKRRKDSANVAFPTSHQESPRIQSDLKRRPRQGDEDDDDDDEGGNYENKDVDGDEDNRSSEDDKPVQLGQVRSSHQLRGSLPDNHDGTGLRRNPKGPPQNGPLQNAQPSKDVNNLIPKGWHLSPLIVPQRAKQTVARIPPVMNVTPSSPALQKVSEIQAIRKQPNGQLPSTKFR